MKSAQGTAKKKDYGSKQSNKFKKVSFSTTVKKQSKREGAVKHGLRFMQLGNMSTSQPSDDVEVSDFNISIVGKEDIHQNPKVEDRLQVHDQAEFEYRTQPFNMVYGTGH